MAIRKKTDIKSEETESQFDAKPIVVSQKVNKRFIKSKGLLLVVISVVLITALGAAAYTYGLYQRSQNEIAKIKSNPEELAKAETKEILSEIEKLLVLPANETPTIATVTDVNKLKNQPFFAKAENGDKVIIYTEAKKAILYRQSIKKVVEVAPINLGDVAGSSDTTSQDDTPAKPTDKPTPQPTEASEQDVEE